MPWRFSRTAPRPRSGWPIDAADPVREPSREDAPITEESGTALPGDWPPARPRPPANLHPCPSLLDGEPLRTRGSVSICESPLLTILGSPFLSRGRPLTPLPLPEAPAWRKATLPGAPRAALPPAPRPRVPLRRQGRVPPRQKGEPPCRTNPLVSTPPSLTPPSGACVAMSDPHLSPRPVFEDGNDGPEVHEPLSDGMYAIGAAGWIWSPAEER